MLRNNELYKKKYAYTLYDVLKQGLVSAGYSFDYPNGNTPINKITRLIFSPYGIRIPTTTEIPATYVDGDYITLIPLVVERYWNEYVFESDEEITSFLSNNQAIMFISKFLHILEFTYEKYSRILASYDSAKTKLLDKLERTSNGTDIRRDNDTPQDTGDFSDDSHTSFITQGETNVTESHDDTSLIERLDKIQTLFQNTMFNWVKEFGILFIDGGNYHEE